MAQPPEPGHHLVGDVEDLVAAADLLGQLMVSGRRHDHAAGGEHRFGDEGAHAVGAGFQDRVLEVPRLAVPPLFEIHAFGAEAGVDARQESH